MRARLPLIAAAGVAVLGAGVATGGDLPGDEAVVRWTRVGEDGAARDLWRGVSAVTSGLPLAAVTAVTVAVLALRKRPRAAVLTAAALALALGGGAVLKQVVERPRPALMLPEAGASAYGFPAGHAAATAALAVVAVLLTRGTRWTWPVRLVALGVVLLTGASQLALARHYPSDLLGGWAWGVASALVVAGAAPGWTGSRERARQGSNLRPSA